MKASEVPSGPLLIDTDVFSYLLARDGKGAPFRPLITGHALALAFATVGELRAGAIRNRWGAQSRTHLETAMRQCVVLVADDAITQQYAELHAHPQVGGQLRGAPARHHNDMWIASCSLARPEHPPVVTNNLVDYQLIAMHFPLRLVHPALNRGDPGWP